MPGENLTPTSRRSEVGVCVKTLDMCEVDWMGRRLIRRQQLSKMSPFFKSAKTLAEITLNVLFPLLN